MWRESASNTPLTVTPASKPPSATVRYYKKIRERNEALDCFVYNLAALEILNPNFERLAKNLTKKEVKLLPDNVKQKPPKQQGGGFVDAWR